MLGSMYLLISILFCVTVYISFIWKSFFCSCKM